MSRYPDLSRSPDYFTARAIEERRMAMAAKDPKVRAIHLEMADRYAELSRQAGPAQGDVIDEQQTAG